MRTARKITAVLFVTAMLAFAGRADTGELYFRDGLGAYRANDFVKASEDFLKAARNEPASGSLQNLGLAEWQRGRIGEAVLAWEQAVWIDPFNRAAQTNLKYARRVAQLEDPDLTWYEAVSTGLPVNWWIWIASVSFWVAAAAVILPGILRRRRSAFSQAIAALGLMVFLLTALAHFGVQTRSKIGVVLQKDALLRLTPTQESQVLARLQPGEPIRMKKTRGKYVLVHNARTSGWMDQAEIGLLSRSL